MCNLNNIKSNPNPFIAIRTDTCPVRATRENKHSWEWNTSPSGAIYSVAIVLNRALEVREVYFSFVVLLVRPQFQNNTFLDVE